MASEKVIIDKEFKDLIPGYLENRKKDVIKLQEAFKNSDFKLIRSMAHKIAGNAGSYGFAQLGDIARNIEVDIDQEKYQGIEILIVKFEEHLKSIEVIYE